MATGQPGPSPSFPSGQARQAFGRDWGSYTTVAGLPNGSGNVLTAGEFKLEAGDHAYLSLSTGQCDYLCISAGTAAGGDAVWVPSSGQGPWLSVLYVDNVRGSNTTGQRGNTNRPFLTIQAAINAMSTADVVQCAPQLFLLTAPLTVPATVIRGGVVGATPLTFRITSTAMPGTNLQLNAGAAIFDLGANLGLTFWEVAQMTLRASGATAIKALGTAYAAGTFLTSGLLVRWVNFENSTTTIDAQYAGGVSVVDSFVGLQVNLIGCGFCTFVRTTANVGNPGGAPITLTWDGADPLSAIGGQFNVISSSCVGLVTMGKSANLLIDPTSTGAGVKGNPAASLAVTGGIIPNVSWAGSIGASNIDFFSAGSELPDTASVLTLHFKGAKGYSSPFSPGNGVQGLSLARFKIAGAAANAQAVNMDSTILPASATVQANANVNLTGRGGSWPNATLSTPDGTGTILPPSPLVIAPVAVAANPQTITYPCRIPAGSVAVSAYVASDNASAVPTQVITAAGQASFAAGLNALPFDAPQFSGIVTGGAGATTAYAGNNPLAATLVPVNYPAGRASRFGVLKVYVTANALVSATTFTLYKNNVATAVTLSVGAAGTGIFSDTTHTADFAVDDRYDLRMDNTAGGVAALVFAATIEQYINPIAGNLRATVMFPG